MNPYIILVLTKSISFTHQTANAKNKSSKIKRNIPDIAIGAAPERLGSLGTAKVPQIEAEIIGIANARTNRNHPSVCFHPQVAKEIKATSSSRKRTARFIGWLPISCLSLTLTIFQFSFPPPF